MLYLMGAHTAPSNSQRKIKHCYAFPYDLGNQLHVNLRYMLKKQENPRCHIIHLVLRSINNQHNQYFQET